MQLPYTRSMSLQLIDGLYLLAQHRFLSGYFIVSKKLWQIKYKNTLGDINFAEFECLAIILFVIKQGIWLKKLASLW